MTRLFLSLIFVLSIASAVNAQKFGELRGIKHVGLLVDGLDQDAQRCGLTRSLVRDAILYPISSSKLEFSDDDTSGPKIFVQIVALVQQRPEQCISNVRFEVVSLQKVQLDYANEPARYVVVQLWRDDWLSVAAFGNHPQQVRTAIENGTKKFIAAWNLANKQ